MLTAVLDTNVLVSAAVSRSTPWRIVEEWRGGAFELVVSLRLLAELERVLRLPELDLPVADVAQVFDEFRAMARFVEDPAAVEPVVPGDPADDFVVALARTAGAHVIVTGDRHLLEIDGLEPPAVTPRVFLLTLEQHGR